MDRMYKQTSWKTKKEIEGWDDVEENVRRLGVREDGEDKLATETRGRELCLEAKTYRGM